MSLTHAPMASLSHPPASSAIAVLENVTKIYEMGDTRVHALAGVSVDFEKGAFYAIMGASGSGKSTMLNVLGCLDRPTTGRFVLEDQDVALLDDDDLSEFRLRHLGFIFQSFNLVAQLTVRENIELPLYYLGWDAGESAQRADELAERVGLADRLEHRPAELSGGQQQRVAFARALANDPLILLADAPTVNLDTSTGKQIMRMLADLHEQGKTILMVTHEPDIAEYASHRLYMRDGLIDRIEERG